MPLSIEFRLVASKSGFIAPFTGGYVRGWFLVNIKQRSEELFKYLHEKQGMRPYAVKPLRPIGKKMRVLNRGWRIENGDRLTFGVSILKESIEDVIFEILVNTENFSFSNIECELDHIIVKKHSYSELLSKAYGARIGLSFRTPTLFDIRGREFPYLFPDPMRIVGNLLNIWNKFAPTEYTMPTDSIIDWASRAIKTKSYKLETREVIIENNAKITGFKGRVEWVILEGEREGITYLSPLLALAEFSNVGSKRTYGLGVVSITDLTKKT
ncbi:MAG: CRISPR-associated endoribonuclease Cas6 [Candidatus Njordarchaeales archaeon]